MRTVLFYLIQFSWGIIMNIIGFVVFLIMIVLLKKPKRFHRIIYFELKGLPGAVSLGIFCLAYKGVSEGVLRHESGHTIQNNLWGPLFLFVIGFPSLTRASFKLYKPGEYYKIWFERQATEFGDKYYSNKEDI